MVKKLLTLLIAIAFVLSVSSPLLAQDKPAKAKKDRVEGMVTINSKDKSTLTVRHVGSNTLKTVMFDATTEWTSQEHGSKKANTIDATQVKEGDRVICEGKFDKDGVLHATLISKRLTQHSSLP
jgi:cytochrome c-type biogenesis protein CcmE